MKNLASLKHRLLLRMAITASAASLLLLVVFLTAYRGQLESERSRASLGFNLLLQAALENAMLKRDVPGLRDIVERLGAQPGIRDVLILHPNGEVRFASRPELLGRKLPELLPTTGAAPRAAFTETETGEVLRSVNPVRNKAPCAPCHGDAAANPVNGILVVDYDAAGIRRQAWVSGAAFAGAGILVLLLILAVLWRDLDRRVLSPVTELAAASAAIESGQLDRRAVVVGDDELATLGQRFNRMADRLGEQMALSRAHEAWLQEILDSLPDGVRVIRISDRRIVLANAAYCEQLGVSRRLALGESCHISSHGRATPCVPTLVSCPLTELTEPGKALKSTHRHRRANGDSFPVEIHAALVAIERNGSTERYLVESIRDLTQAAQVSHEQRLSELGLLAAGVAHEIHNPLASVRLGVQGLSRDLRDGRASAEDIVGYLDLIDSETDKCIAVTRRMLLLSRAPDTIRQIVDVGHVLDDTLRLLDYDARSRRIESRLDMPPEPVRVLADDSELRMVFLNLVQNAHHAMGGGGRLLIRLGSEDGEAIVAIEDSGCGIEPEALAKIFDPFYSRRADGVAGTGLGLSIVKNIVEHHHGRIEVTSEPGHGTVFRVRLPLAEHSMDRA
jgi:PAS domain S-box-containing protein